MKLFQLLLLVALLVATATADFDARKFRAKMQADAEGANLFVQSWRNLHRGPPQVAGQASSRFVSEAWIEQKLDHFDASVTDTWSMRYLINDEYFQEGGPMFIYLGGEWAISPGSIMSGHFVDMAKEHNAILYYTEHRYYGKSLPTDDITVDNLKYLHVKQALADLAHFIEYQRSNNPALANSSVIMAGGSYSATMVVWFKHLYPDLLTGGWASSAPLLAKVDYREYKEVVGRAILELGGQQCYNRVQNGVAELEEMFVNKRGAEVKAMMKLCNKFDEHNDLDLWSLFSTISNIFAGIVQYQEGNDLLELCTYLMLFDDDVTAIADLLAMDAYVGCNDFTYKNTLSYYMDSSYSYGAGRPWYYQTCNEYGWYQSSGSTNQPFGTKFPVTLYTTLCRDVFGDAYTPENINAKAAQTNEDFGGMQPRAENVYMTHGGLDPWNAVGHNELQGATVIPRASHCADLGSIRDYDSAEMRASKERVASLVREWLAS